MEKGPSTKVPGEGNTSFIPAEVFRTIADANVGKADKIKGRGISI